ncbi:hypothetical protein L873DRAFT_1805371 [Choiromyces venosus 120613-1]|uniref:Uncharacterized protein n=1 Tax=Choiromyces venosus 120613-1 TaxID=1336337 RepID=A0A3N4K2X4_9PEZI|nr:hypothetical protein L873DRAFT_1805371 [Choiromyces venosus 120613-1]
MCPASKLYEMFGPPLLANALGSAMVIWQITKNNGKAKKDITRAVEELKMDLALIDKRVNMANDNMPMVPPAATVAIGTSNDLGMCRFGHASRFCHLSGGEDS